MAPKLLLIDALNMIRRIHAAVPAPDNNRQVDGALSATLSSLHRAIRYCRPSHLLVVFDGDPPTWRHELLPDYKSQRKPMPAELRARLTDFNELFRHNGMMTFRRNGVEADDVIGAVAHKATGADIPVSVLSTDKVFRQLLSSPLVTVRDHFNKIDLTGADIIRDQGVRAEQLTELWAMSGLGELAGVVGVGEKGALKLLQEYGSLERIMGQEGDVKGALAKVLQQKEQALLSQKLATLQGEIELGMSLKEMRYTGQGLQDSKPL